MTTIFGFKKVKTNFIILKCNEILKLSNNSTFELEERSESGLVDLIES